MNGGRDGPLDFENARTLLDDSGRFCLDQCLAAWVLFYLRLSQ